MLNPKLLGSLNGKKPRSFSLNRNTHSLTGDNPKRKQLHAKRKWQRSQNVWHGE
jgi:hypothetical protein